MADTSNSARREPTQIKSKNKRPGSIHLFVRWLSQTAFVKTAKRFKEIWTILVFLALGAYAGISYFAPASELKRIDCALEHQRTLAIKRDEEVGFKREVKSLRDQKDLIVDFLLLLQPEENDSVSIKQFKSKIRGHLDSKRGKIGEKIHDVELKALAMQEEVSEIDRAFTRKTCP